MLYRLNTKNKELGEHLKDATQAGAILRTIKKVQPATAAAIRTATLRSSSKMFPKTKGDPTRSRRFAFYLTKLKASRLVVAASR